VSVVSELVFEPGRLPKFEAIRQGALSVGRGVDIHPFDPATHTGYLPIKMAGRTAGFEYYYRQDASDELGPEARRFGTSCISAVTFGDFEEFRAASIFLLIAARLTSGAYLYAADDILVPPNDTDTYLLSEIDEVNRIIRTG
jgi:hypothetical protein